MRDDGPIIIEKRDVRCVHVAFLRAIPELWKHGSVIVCSDET